LVLFPGIVIRRSFYRNKFSKQFYRGQFAERLLTTLFWGIVNILISFVTFYLIAKVIFGLSWCITCDIQSFLCQMSSYNYLNYSRLLTNISYGDAGVFTFMLLFYLFIQPFGLGYIAYIFVRKMGIDLKHSAFAFSNHWHYFFQGEILYEADKKIVNKQNFEFRKNKNRVSIVDVLTIEGSDKYIYKGILLDYNLKDDNEDLESIILYEPMKKKYDKDFDEDGRQRALNFVKIPGSFILIPYSNVLNINVYIKSLENTIEKPAPITEKEINADLSTKTNTRNGCIFGLAILGIIILAVIFANEVSYLRFTLGLLLSFFMISLCQILVISLSKVFTYKKLIYCFIILFIFYNLFVWIFNVDTYNPISKVIDYLVELFYFISSYF